MHLFGLTFLLYFPKSITFSTKSNKFTMLTNENKTIVPKVKSNAMSTSKLIQKLQNKCNVQI